MEPEYLTVQEAAALLRVAPQTIRRWADNGNLPCIRIGRTLRIPKRELESRKIQESQKTPSYLTMTDEERRVYAADMMARTLAFHDETRAKYGNVGDSVRELAEIRAEQDKDGE